MDNISSILDSIKKPLNVPLDEPSFDSEIIMHINSTFMSLTQLGVGPKIGFYIEDKTPVWTDFVDDKFMVEPLKTYVFIKVKLIFDPPQNTAVIEAMNSSAEQYEYRIREWAEEKASNII